MLKWVSKDNLITFWNEIREQLAGVVAEEVDEVVGPIIDDAKSDIIDNYISNILGNFGTVESSDQASQNYSVGGHLVYNKNFYKVTSAIASGDTLEEGANIEQTTVGEEMANSLVLLWTNSGPTNSFSAQTIPLDLSEYQAVLIEFFEYTGTTSRFVIQTRMAIVGEYYSQCVISGYCNGTSLEAFSYRMFRVDTTSAIYFEDAYNQSAKNNYQCVPYKIYGIK